MTTTHYAAWHRARRVLRRRVDCVPVVHQYCGYCCRLQAASSMPALPTTTMQHCFQNLGLSCIYELCCAVELVLSDGKHVSSHCIRCVLAAPHCHCAASTGAGLGHLSEVVSQLLQCAHGRHCTWYSVLQAYRMSIELGVCAAVGPASACIQHAAASVAMDLELNNLFVTWRTDPSRSCTCAQVVARYTVPNLSAEGALRLRSFFRVSAMLAEIFVFVYIGCAYPSVSCQLHTCLLARMASG
jgi:hypothetical protein